MPARCMSASWTATGKKLVHTNIKNNDFAYFLKLVAPYRHDLTVCAECMFGWYWLADACQAAGLHFVLAHALYLKAIHGGKNKNDRIDSEKLAHLLRSNLIPPGYVYPAAQRPLRALLRQRLYFVWRRSRTAGPPPVPSTGPQPAHPPTDAAQPRSVGAATPRGRTRTRPPARPPKRSGPDRPLRHPDLRPRKGTPALTKKSAARDYALLQTVPGIGEHLGADHPLRDRRHRALPHREGLPLLLPPGQRHRRQRRQDQRPARRQAGQPVSALGLRRSGRDRQTRSARHRPAGPTPGSAR